jgi:DNA polymerase-1
MPARKNTSGEQLSFGAPPAPADAKKPSAKKAAATAAPAGPRLYLVDASAYMYRAFHAIPFLSTSRGVPTNAAYGVTNMLLKLLKEERPTHLGLVFDAPGGSFRDEMYADYKANRSSMPDELVPQIGLIRRVVEVLRPRVIEVPGVEADDVIGTLAKRVADAGGEVVIVTGDKDFQQLVGPRITLLDPMFDKRTGVDQVRERYGIEPERWVDIIGLMGDAIDNIPGIRGVGEKTASALIQHAGTLEALLADPDAIAKSGIRGAAGLIEKVRAHSEQAALAKRLATIRCDLEVAETFDDFRYAGPDRAALEELCRELEFHRLLREIPLLTVVAEETAAESAPVALDGREGDEVLPDVAAAAECGVFVDATVEPAMRATLAAVVAAPLVDAHVTRSVPLAADDPVARMLASPTVAKVGEDLKRAILVLERHGIALAGPLFDVSLASYVLDPSRASHGVDELARHFLGMTAPAEDATIRAPWTARTALALRPVLESALERHGGLALFRDVEMPLLAVLAAMERRGVRVDTDALAALAAEYRATVARIEAEIYELAGGPFNINSPIQLREVLFDRLKISAKGLRKGKTGISLDVDAMNKLATVHPLPAKILEHRALSKLLSTYIDPLPLLVNPDTGRIHTSFNQTVAATGRLSSADPNLQNIPIRSDEGRRIRAAFVPAPGKVLIGADYSQIELRVLAHLTGDPVLVEAFTTGEDIHTRTAAEVFDVTPLLVTAEMRRRAKVINFGIIYGMGPQRLSRELSIPLVDAQKYIKNYFARLTGVTSFVETTLAEARRQGFVSTVLGRRRYLPELSSPDDNLRSFAERTAINTPVQGSAADLIKLAMVKLEARLTGGRLPGAMILQVHDELVFEADAGAADEVAAVIKHEMETVMPLAVPLLVDMRTAKSWAETH